MCFSGVDVPTIEKIRRSGRIGQSLRFRQYARREAFHPSWCAASSGDELEGPRDLGTWLSQRGLLLTNAKISPAMFATALELRGSIRDYLQCDPAGRNKDKAAVRALDKALNLFPLVVEAQERRGVALKAARDDALAGLSSVVVELYEGARNGTLDRLKMCASRGVPPRCSSTGRSRRRAAGACRRCVETG